MGTSVSAESRDFRQRPGAPERLARPDGAGSDEGRDRGADEQCGVTCARIASGIARCATQSSLGRTNFDRGQVAAHFSEASAKQKRDRSGRVQWAWRGAVGLSRRVGGGSDAGEEKSAGLESGRESGRLNWYKSSSRSACGALRRNPPKNRYFSAGRGAKRAFQQHFEDISTAVYALS